MSMIDASEDEDFDNALKRGGYKKEDFEIVQSEDPLPRQGIGHVTGTITVRNKRTGVHRTYNAGYATAWVADFDQDLQSGAFGHPE
jgi:hypothetical protein